MTEQEEKQGYTEELYQEFFKAYMDSGSPTYLRNVARVQMNKIVHTHGKEICDKMFERVKLEPSFEE